MVGPGVCASNATVGSIVGWVGHGWEYTVVNAQRISVRVALATIALGIALLAGLQLTQRTAGAAVPEPTEADTARLLGYMWADGSKSGSTWDVNGPSGTSTLIEYLVEEHGGVWVNRAKLQFRMPAQYDWPEWTDGLPDDSARVRDAVQLQHFLAAVLEAEASLDGVIYDQAADDGYTVGRLEELRQLLRDKGYSSARRVEWATPDRGQVTIDSGDFARLRQKHRFVCPAEGDSIRIPGGEDYDRYGNLRWFTDANRWAGLTRNDCRSGVDVTPVPAPAGTCRATIDANDRVTVDWTFTRGNVVIRRNGAYVDAVTVFGPAFTETPADGTWTYSVRVFAGGEQGNATCGTVTTGGGEPPVGPPANGCVASAVGGGVQLSWDDFGVTPYVVRRNGSWVETLNATSTVVSGSIDDSFVIRRRVGGTIVDVACSANGGGVEPCSVTAVNGGVRLDFAAIDGVSRRVVRVNGSWLATLDGLTSFTDPNGDTGDSYVIRHRIGADRIDIACI